MSCPICAKDAAKAYRPFCSRRCADVDLGRWLNASYAIPAEPADVTDEMDQDRVISADDRGHRSH